VTAFPPRTVFGTLAEQRPATGTRAEARQLGALIYSARKRAGLTQRAVAELIGVTNVAVAQWERGQARPGIEKRLDLSQALGIPVHQLLPQVPGQIDLSDPVIIQTVQQLAELSPPMRQVVLMLIAALRTLPGTSA
jgi:transcriptional regulator with XRE-family HTH domain